MNQKYTPEQVADIEAREKEAIETLKRLELTPSAVLNSINIGDDVFATKVTPFLQDIKFSQQANPATSQPSANVEPKQDAESSVS